MTSVLIARTYGLTNEIIQNHTNSPLATLLSSWFSIEFVGKTDVPVLQRWCVWSKSGEPWRIVVTLRIAVANGCNNDTTSRRQIAICRMNFSEWRSRWPGSSKNVIFLNKDGIFLERDRAIITITATIIISNRRRSSSSSNNNNNSKRSRNNRSRSSINRKINSNNNNRLHNSNINQRLRVQKFICDIDSAEEALAGPEQTSVVCSLYEVLDRWVATIIFLSTSSRIRESCSSFEFSGQIFEGLGYEAISS